MPHVWFLPHVMSWLLPSALLLQTLSVFSLISLVVYYNGYVVCALLFVALLLSCYTPSRDVSSAYFVPFSAASLLGWSYLFVASGLAPFFVYVSPLCFVSVSLAAFVYHRFSPWIDSLTCHWSLLLLSVSTLPSLYFFPACVHSVMVFCGVVTLLHNYSLHKAVFHVLPTESAPQSSEVAAYNVRRMSVVI